MIFYATKLRAIAIIGVLLIHISARLVTQDVGTYNWWIGNIFNSSSRWSVPIFIMLSGMLLLGRKESQSLVIKKRVTKIAWPFLFWSFIYFVWMFRYDIDAFSTKEFLIRFFEGSIKYHLWYLYTILGLYLAMPLFKALVHSKKTDIRYIIAISFLISAIFTTIAFLFNLKPAGGFELFLGYGSYFLLGYYAANTAISKKISLFIYSAGIISLLATILGTWLVSSRQDSLNQVFYEYLSITTPFVAIAIFLFLKQFGNKTCGTITSLTAKYSFGIYLVHPIFLDIYRSKEFIAMTGISHNSTPVLFYLAFMLLAVYASSLLATMLMHKIPFIRRIA
ncbi:acyltransferase [Cytobacillus firmus]|uniref:Acyltransferase family protein n=1 Tax=Cytobacillus firmus TaxID=1399 RepID=A0AA46Q1H8_CYTFI|nr:acyltransferase family protein [Cytobacillus firmus]UYG93854.1 acyltransferase family protein [Cytobacillus firmus]